MNTTYRIRCWADAASDRFMDFGVTLRGDDNYAELQDLMHTIVATGYFSGRIYNVGWPAATKVVCCTIITDEDLKREREVQYDD